ncbi:MAG: alanine dehydrogenase [Planctomycetes bacterium RBG_16_59_8]|nr:MAG: alanine dehydrogenase [Planctomycetes bacterium RBG_16_59_8]
MKIGVPKEIKPDEYRVAIVPAGVHELVRNNHKVFIEKQAGVGSGIGDQAFEEAGATIVRTREEVFAQCEMIIKVKEPMPEEYKLIDRRHILFTYLHLAAMKELTQAMAESEAVCIAYETIERPDGSLPLLTPMSEVAGRMAVQEGAKYLEKPMEGRGILLGGVPGVPPASVVILGGGIVGSNAAHMAAGLGSRVWILDINLDRLRYLSDIMPPNVVTLYSNAFNIQERLREADLVIGAVLISGAKAPTLIPRSYLSLMKQGAVIVDVAVDQGGCVETTRPTTHGKPTFIVDNVVHYCVANMPGAVGNTSTYALTNATLPYAVEIANKGWKRAAKENRSIARGLNVVQGKITYQGVADAHAMKCAPVGQLID